MIDALSVGTLPRESASLTCGTSTLFRQCYHLSMVRKCEEMFRRLNDCIYTIVKRSNETLHVYNERRAQNEVQILKRRQARVLLFSVLHMAEKPLTSEEIEEEWKRMRGCNSLPAGLTNEMLRMVNSNKRCFEVVRHGDGEIFSPL
ncbi:hypothetical protein NECAME_04061 [Necator americanus]|uniref:Uncharacterized protein n=1 Tax=Necator americanus TaxID=51031 RepID=W2T092_NECAM|nr:hypothetical protein NECAME_04061 [Necator americanus]ETN74382.1 hypothetical protein NECAME_04061 [Necator americanus]